MSKSPEQPRLASAVRQLGAVLLCAAMAGAAMAQETRLPEPRQEGSVSFITGGIGADEAQAFRDAAGAYNLRLTFATPQGEYYASVHVVLSDARGQVLADTTSDGPFLFFRVPAGRYRIVAECDGKTMRRDASVGEGRSADLVVRWPPESIASP